MNYKESFLSFEPGFSLNIFSQRSSYRLTSVRLSSAQCGLNALHTVVSISFFLDSGSLMNVGLNPLFEKDMALKRA